MKGEYSIKFFSDTSFRVLKEVLAWKHEYSPWEPKGFIVLKPFQREVVDKNIELFKQKQIVSDEIFCAGGKTAIGAYTAIPFIKDGQKVAYISTNRAVFQHFEDEFKRVLSSEKMDPDIVWSSKGPGGISAFRVDKQVLIFSPYDLVSPNVGPAERKVIEETLKKFGLIIIDEVHRIPKDPQNETIIIGKVEPIIREKAIPFGAKVLTTTGTHFREDAKAPFGIDTPDIQKTCQDLILEGCIAQLYGFPVIVDIDVKDKEIKKQNDVIQLKLDRKRLFRYMDKVADIVTEVIKHEDDFVKRVGALKPGGHAIFVSRQRDAIVLCDILNKRLGWGAFVPYVSNCVSASERKEILERLRDGRLLGYVTVMMGVESLDVPRLKYVHLVARITSGTKLMQAIGRGMRLPSLDDPDCIKIKDKAVVIDYQVRKKRILRLSLGIRDVARIGGSKLNPDDAYVGGAIFKGPSQDIDLAKSSVSLNKMESWSFNTGEESGPEKNKRILLSLALGTPRLKYRTKLAQALCNYTFKNSGCYDAEFDKVIRERFPHWFVDLLEEKKKALLSLPFDSTKPNCYSTFGRILYFHTDKDKHRYDPEFDKAIRERFPHWFIDTTAENRKALLALAISSPRPSCKTKLGHRLCAYTSKGSKPYNAEFDRAIRERFPHWFVDTAAESKKIILGLPLGSARPTAKTKLGHRLCAYTTKSDCYDAEFNKAVRSRFPHWFVNTAEESKKILLGLPLGSARPKQGTKLGSRLSNYTQNGGACYDAEFDKAIRERFPHWFVDTAAESKKILLGLPLGSARPKQKTKLGSRLCSYTRNKSECYDPEFDKAIRERFPGWFVDCAAENKKFMLGLPLGSPRPNQKTAAGNMLFHYITEGYSSYDAEFAKIIRERFPGWFVNTVDENRKFLLSLPLESPKPKGSKNKLADALARYTKKEASCYDPEFDKAIRERFPHWFVKFSEKNKEIILTLPVDSPRPNAKTKLGMALLNYMTKVKFNAEFIDSVRNRFPHWFVDTAAENKKEMLALPLDSSKPNSKTTKLGRALNNYIGKNSTSYDAEFDKAIRERFPHWFKRRRASESISSQVRFSA